MRIIKDAFARWIHLEVTRMDSAASASCIQLRRLNPNWKMRDPQLPKSLWWHTNAPLVGVRVVRPVNEPASADEMEEYWIEAIQDYN